MAARREEKSPPRASGPHIGGGLGNKGIFWGRMKILVFMVEKMFGGLGTQGVVPSSIDDFTEGALAGLGRGPGRAKPQDCWRQT